MLPLARPARDSTRAVTEYFVSTKSRRRTTHNPGGNSDRSRNAFGGRRGPGPLHRIGSGPARVSRIADEVAADTMVIYHRRLVAGDGPAVALAVAISRTQGAPAPLT